MSSESNQKVTAGHLKRDAYLYVRQSTMRQVFENTESTERQYALRQRAIALGWPSDRVIVIDSDLGQSGVSAVDRTGFQKLVAEVSRLARNSADWHRLLEICALTDTLILDEDGLYDPAHFNDRLLLGLKGTMSEAELYMMRARLRGGILNKARRGELHCGLPAGLIYDAQGRVVLDPDRQVQETVRLLFQTFARTGTLNSTVKHFRRQGLGCRSRRPTVPPTDPTVSVQLQEMQYENRSFSIDVLECPRCGGRMRILAAINPPETIQKILKCLGIPSRPPPLASAISPTAGFYLFFGGLADDEEVIPGTSEKIGRACHSCTVSPPATWV